jgi:hypothetical protein
MIRRAALAAAVLVSASVASAFTRNAAIWGPSRIPVAYKVNASTVPSSLGSAAGVGAIEAGFSSWAAPSCTVWSARNAGASAVTTPAARDAENSILWISGPPGSWPAELGAEGSTIGITTSTFITNGNLTDADISLNAIGFTWGDGSSRTVDAQSILTHEAGHFLGLGHTQVAGSVMIAAYTSGQVRTLSADDREGVCALYPPGSLDAGVPDGGFGSSPFGATCNSSSDCASGICIRTASGSGTCTVPCADDCSCPAGFLCAALSSGGRVCAAGANRCGADAGPDAGLDASAGDAAARDAGADAGAQDAGAVRDASTLGDAGSDDDGGAGPDAARAFDGTVVLSTGASDGCTCRAVGPARGAPSSASSAALIGVIALWMRRRARDSR